MVVYPMNDDEVYEVHVRSRGRSRTSTDSTGKPRRHSPESHISITSSQQAIKRPTSRKKPSRPSSTGKLRVTPEEIPTKLPQNDSPDRVKDVPSFRAQIINLTAQCQSPNFSKEREQFAKYQPSMMSGWAEGRPNTPTVIKRPTNMEPPYDPVLGDTFSLTNKSIAGPFQQCSKKMERQKQSLEECTNDIYEGYKDMCTTQRAINLETSSFFSKGTPDLRSSSTISSKSKSQRYFFSKSDDELNLSRYYADGKRKSSPPGTPSKSIASGRLASPESSLLGDKLVDEEKRSAARNDESHTNNSAPRESNSYNPQEDSQELESDSDDLEEFQLPNQTEIPLELFKIPPNACVHPKSRPESPALSTTTLNRMRVQENAILDLSIELEDTKREVAKSSHDLHQQIEIDAKMIQEFTRRMAQYESTISVMEKRLTREMKEKEELRLELKASTIAGDSSNSKTSSTTAQDATLVAALHEQIGKLKNQLAAKEAKDQIQKVTRPSSPGTTRTDPLASRAELFRVKAKLEKAEREIKTLRREIGDAPSNSQLLAKVISELQLAKKTEENLASQLAQVKNELASAKVRERQFIRKRSTNETLELRARVLQLEKEAEMVRTQSREEVQGRREESYKLKEEVKRLKQELSDAAEKVLNEAKERTTDRKMFESKLFASQKSSMDLQDSLRITQERLNKAETGSHNSPGRDKDLSKSTYTSLSKSYEAEIAVLKRKLEMCQMQIKEERKLAFDVDQRRMEDIQRLHNHLESGPTQNVSSNLDKMVDVLRSQLNDAQEEIKILRRVSYKKSLDGERGGMLSKGRVSPSSQLRKDSPSRLSIRSIESIRSPESIHRSKEQGFLTPPYTPQHMPSFASAAVPRQIKQPNLSPTPFIPPSQISITTPSDQMK